MTDKCAGENCTSIDGFNHSVECLFEHFTAYTGAHRESVDVLGKIKKAYFDGYEAAAPAQPPSQGGEAVEVVASIAVDAEGVVRDFTLEPGLDRHPGGYTVTSLMTVAQHKRILAAQPQSDAVIVPRDVVLFLTGEGALDGWFFEEQRPDQHIVGQYWWRKHLRALLGGDHE